MSGWETVLAALGGLLLGFGAGLVATRRRERALERRITRFSQQLRSHVVPVLEERAASLGLSPSERSSESDDPLTLAVSLAGSIQRFSDARTLPFSDTLDAASRIVAEES